MEKLKEMKSKLGFLIDELTTLTEKEGDRTKEEYEALQVKTTEAKELREKIEKEEAAQKVLEELKTEEPEKESHTEATSGITFPDPPEFRSFGEYLQAVVRAGTPGEGGYIGGLPAGIIDKRLIRTMDKEQRAATGASEAIPSEGGFMVHPKYSAEFLKRVYETGVLVSKVRKASLTSNNTSIKINGIDETSRADGSRWGGLRVYWTDEAAQMTSSKAKLKEITLTLNKLTGLYYATDEIIQDAGVLGSYVMETMPQEFAFKLDDEIFDGDGAGKPLGIKDCNAAVSITKETSQVADTIVVENLAKMYARMWDPGKSRAIWLMNTDCIPQLMTLSIAVGTGGGPVFMSSVQAAPTFTIFARPVYFVEHAKTIGDAADVMFVDLSQYLFIDKGGIQSASSIHLRFDYNETAFRWTYRCDGQPLWTSALTPYQGTNTLSPFIKLGART